jgi:hypothetical protein
VQSTRHDDLYRYAVIEIAAARFRPLVDLLYSLAATCPAKRIPGLIEALNLTSDPRRENTLALLKRRI